MSDVVPPLARRVLYVLVVLVDAAAVIAHGFEVIAPEHLVAVLAGLGILSSGLALGYVPGKEPTHPTGTGRHRADA